MFSYICALTCTSDWCDQVKLPPSDNGYVTVEHLPTLSNIDSCGMHSLKCICNHLVFFLPHVALDQLLHEAPEIVQNFVETDCYHDLKCCCERFCYSKPEG